MILSVKNFVLDELVYMSKLAPSLSLIGVNMEGSK